MEQLSIQAASDQFDIFTEYYDIDFGDNEDVRSGFEGARSKIIRAICKGKLEISLDKEGDVVVTQTLKSGEKLEYAVICGRHKIAMKTKGENDSYGKIYALMGAISKLGEGGILRVKGADLGLIESLGLFYLQV